MGEKMDHSENKTVSLQDVREYAGKRDISIREAEMMLLDEGVTPLRYLHNVSFWGREAQIKLLASRVFVLGLGGLGGALCEILARLGVGRLVLVDSDQFDESNLNRQLLCRECDLGKDKAAQARERVLNINSAIDVEIHVLHADANSIEPLLAGCSLALDALDNVESRVMLEKACLNMGVPLIHGALGNTSFQVSTIKRRPLLQNLYANAETTIMGNLVPTIFMCAAFEAAEAVKVLTGLGDVLESELLLGDWLHNTYDKLTLA